MASNNSLTPSDGDFNSDMHASDKEEFKKENQKKKENYRCRTDSVQIGQSDLPTRSDGHGRKSEIDAELDEALAFTKFVSHSTALPTYIRRKSAGMSNENDESKSYRQMTVIEENKPDTDMLNDKGVYSISPVKDSGRIDGDNKIDGTIHEHVFENTPDRSTSYIQRVKPVKSEECNVAFKCRSKTKAEFDRPVTNIGGNSGRGKTKRKKRTRISERNDEIKIWNLRINLEELITKNSKGTTADINCELEKSKHMGDIDVEVGSKSEVGSLSEGVEKCGGNSTYPVCKQDTSQEGIQRASCNDEMELADLLYDSPTTVSWSDHKPDTSQKGVQHASRTDEMDLADLLYDSSTTGSGSDDTSSDYGYNTDTSSQLSPRSKMTHDGDCPLQDGPGESTSNRTYAIRDSLGTSQRHTGRKPKKTGKLIKLWKYLTCCWRPKEEN